MSNKVYYIGCGSCGYEDFDVNVSFVRHVANGDVWECPECKQETMNVEIEEEK